MTRAALFGASRAWVAQLTRVLARFEPCAVTAVHDPAQLGAVISGERPTLLVTDHDGRRFDSRAALGVMRYLAPDVPVVVYATAGSEEVAVAAIKGGAADYLPAPADDAELQAVLRETIDAPRQAPRIRSHDRFADLLDHLDVGVYRTNADGMLLAANPAMARILRQPTVSALLDMSRARPAGTHAGALIRQDGAIKGVFVDATERLRLPTGEVVIQGDGRAIHDDRGELVGFEGYIRDVTNRECARKAATLRAMMLDQAQHAVIGVDEDLAVSYWNKGAERMLGWTSAEVLGGEAVWLAGQLMSAGTVASVRAIFNSAGAWTGETTLRHRNGAPREVFGRAIRLVVDDAPAGSLAVFVDVTRQKQIEAQLQQAVAQHERLVSETHRRVKSNLQVVSSLLRVELACADDSELRHLAQETQNRIRAIAVMHEWLLQSPDRSSVDMKVYLERITQSLSLAYAARGTARVVCEADALTLEVDQATRIGLIVNELVVNALKHAFVRRARGGVVAVRLTRSGADAELVVRDNGSGLPTGFALESSASLGLTLVNDLAARLGAALTIESGRGTAVRLTFPCHDPA